MFNGIGGRIGAGINQVRENVVLRFDEAKEVAKEVATALVEESDDMAGEDYMDEDMNHSLFDRPSIQNAPRLTASDLPSIKTVPPCPSDRLDSLRKEHVKKVKSMNKVLDGEPKTVDLEEWHHDEVPPSMIDVKVDNLSPVSPPAIYLNDLTSKEPEAVLLAEPYNDDDAVSLETLVDDDISEEDHGSMAMQLKETMALNESLLVESERLQIENESYRFGHQELENESRKLDETNASLQQKINSINVEYADMEKQLQQWRTQSMKYEAAVSELQVANRELTQKQSYIASSMFSPSGGEDHELTDRLKIKDEEIDQLHNDAHLASSQIKELNEKLALTNSILDETSLQCSHQSGALADQVRDNEHLRSQLAEMKSEIGALKDAVQEADLEHTRLSEQLREVDERSKGKDAKLLDLENGTKILLDRLTKYKVNDELLLNIKDLKEGVEKMVADHDTNSPLPGEVRWQVMDYLCDHLQLSSWQRKWWIALEDEAPKAEQKATGLGYQFLSFLETDTQ